MHLREAIEAAGSPASMAGRWQCRVFQGLTHHRTRPAAPGRGADGFIEKTLPLHFYFSLFFPGRMASVDKEDSSVTRSAEYLEGLFKAGGLNVVRFHQRMHHACPHAACRVAKRKQGGGGA